MRPLLSVFVLALTGCSSSEPRLWEPRDPLVMAQHQFVDIQWTDWRIADAMAKAGRTGDAMRRVDRSLKRRIPPGVAPYFVDWMERLRTALSNRPLELSNRLIDLAPEPPPPCCEQPRRIRKLRRR